MELSSYCSMHPHAHFLYKEKRYMVINLLFYDDVIACMTILIVCKTVGLLNVHKWSSFEIWARFISQF